MLLDHDPVQRYKEDLDELLRWHLANDPGPERLASLPVHEELTIPGDTLVGLIGRGRCLSANTNAEPIDEETKAKIREKYPSPQIFFAGSFEGIRNRLLEQVARIENTEMQAAAADEDCEFEEEKETILDILEARLEVGYFVLGLRDLWPEEGRFLEQQLWSTKGLQKFDEDLTDNLARFAPDVRELLMDEPLRLVDTDIAFAPLLKLAREGTPYA